MKVIVTILVFTLIAKVSFAQKDQLSFDEHNKYIYYQVVDAPGVQADTLHADIAYFLKNSYPKVNVKAAKTNPGDIVAEGKFVSYSSNLVLKHESGEMDYVINIEFKDQKFRYWITGFSYTPYERDRYGSYVPRVGVDFPLETLETKIEKREAENQLNATGAFCKQFNDSLKVFMTKPKAVKKQETAKKVEPEKKVVTDKW